MTATGNPMFFIAGRGGRPPGRSTWKFANGATATFGDQAAKARLFDKMVVNLDENDLALLEAAIAGRRVSASGSFSIRTVVQTPGAELRPPRREASMVAALPLAEGPKNEDPPRLPAGAPGP